MRLLKWAVLSVLMVLSITAYAQAQTVFTVNGLVLTNGWKVTGTITTDGTVGPLTASNILDWNLKVVGTTDVVWTQKDSVDVSSSGLSCDGKKIHVATSPDGILDGGALVFSRGGGGGRIQTSAVIADFTQLGVNLGYIGGIAGWQDEIWGLNFVGLNQRNGIQYHAASLMANLPTTYRINVPTLATTPLLMTMFGTITTDGTLGRLTPANIVSWNITARNQDITYYNRTNSAVLTTTGLKSTGTLLRVDHVGGQFQIGIGGARPTFVTLADFTDPTYPDGFANYYRGNFGVMGDKSPLVGPKAKAVTVAH